MERVAGVVIDEQRLADFCERHGIARLALFGSALRERFDPSSDIDLLVEFEAGRLPGLLGLSALERELEQFFGGRRVDLRTAGELSPRFRDRVQAEARELYTAA